MSLDKKHVFFFSQKTKIAKSTNTDLFGIRARLAVELADKSLPVLPGLIIDSELAGNITDISFEKDLQKYMDLFSAEVGKKFGDKNHPLLLKYVVSSNMAIAQYPLLHNIGLAKDTIPGFEDKVGAEFTANELLFLTHGALKIEQAVAQIENDAKKLKTLNETTAEIGSTLKAKNIKLSSSEIIARYESLLPKNFYESAAEQAEVLLKRVSRLLAIDEQNENDTAILVHPMVYGNYTKNSCSGACFTRNVVSGEKKLQGQFFAEAYNELFTPGKEIETIEPKYYKQLTKIAAQLEDEFKDIRQIRFTIENGKLWLIEQKSVEQRSTASLIMLYFDLLKRKLIDDTTLLNAFKPEQLSELLHPVIEEQSVKNLPTAAGGISGAPGAAVGRVYFSTDALIEAKRLAKQHGEDDRCILLMSATYAGDVKAIEQSTGVLSNEGGYSAHASVVSRQYGKISLVRPDMKISGKKAQIGDIQIKEGDYLTLNVPYYGTPYIYKGEAKLTQPNPDKLGLFDIVNLCKKHLGNFTVRANADSPKDAELAMKFGADGIGLCRTEHMFFNEERINLFRSMILAENADERKKQLAELQKIQTKDFYGIFKVMAGKHVTIRLLDSPLHEFLPHNNEEITALLAYMAASGNKMSKAELEARINALAENNPMLGHRGCRIAVSYPEIYEMQVRAIFDAACKLQKEKIKVSPEIMIPIIMNAAELKLIVYGKKIEGHTYQGLVDIAHEVCTAHGAKNMDYKVGTMIELPCAALGAGEIARYAQFFSFGTNDLSQTTLGLSRDDFNSFMPDYTMYDLVNGNPFAVLDPRVKDLISIAAERGKASRPDLLLGLCGEHGAVPENIQFCMESGLNYVSCSAYSVPIALLAVAQIHLSESKK
ncbi:MAG: PEP-utilizing enzyme [Bacteroides sp.]|nr:PEP-utilizing enzyme [Prevotella sp.]MCM1408600.1 PEP-utilizing enzyme [Treponema brennaborense]MCM1468912.1 PEP-utilizing enzyme [Bacteroides sp.]